MIAVAPGSGRLVVNAGSPPILVRITRQGFTGLARYRHLEEALDDE